MTNEQLNILLDGIRKQIETAKEGMSTFIEDEYKVPKPSHQEWQHKPRSIGLGCFDFACNQRTSPDHWIEMFIEEEYTALDFLDDVLTSIDSYQNILKPT